MGAHPGLDEVVAGAWRAFERASCPPRVHRSVPVLFFGDLSAYEASPLKVVTVGLNPSLHEFPPASPFQRFPRAESIDAEGDPDRYIKALSCYFHRKPYWWFRSFELLLNGVGASYCAKRASTALHTDICSPVATDPTWSKLDDSDRKRLADDGVPLWNELLEVLRPNVVLVSVHKQYLKGISFNERGPWEPVRRFAVTGCGKPRRPYAVSGRWYEIAGAATLVVFCPNGRGPVMISRDQKQELGEIVLRRFRDGP